MATRERGKMSISQEINEKKDLFLSSPKNSNVLLDLLGLISSDDCQVILSCQVAVEQIFCHLIKTGVILSIGETEPDEVQEKYRKWLTERYDETKETLLGHLHNENTDIQIGALNVILGLVAAESLAHDKSVYEHVPLMQELISKLLTDEINLQIVILEFAKYLRYDDIKLYTLKSAYLLIVKSSPSAKNEIFYINVFGLLSSIKVAASPRAADNTVTYCFHGVKEFVFPHSNGKKLFSLLWLSFLKNDLPTHIIKKIVIIMHEEILPNLQNPLVLTDFLTEAYNSGGAISLLALNGLYILISKYNLEYPDFFTKFYSLFEPQIFYAKYRARFFYLADVFLSSTHLPAYLVAAFAKKLARLSLQAPPNILLLTIPFICNLLIRHPSLEKMIHNPDAQLDINNDPYIFTEPDPLKSKAMDSSLWEIKTLQSHWHPDVAKKAHYIDNRLPQMEWDISALLETSFEDMMNKEKRKKIKSVPLSYHIPSGLLRHNEDELSALWEL